MPTLRPFLRALVAGALLSAVYAGLLVVRPSAGANPSRAPASRNVATTSTTTSTTTTSTTSSTTTTTVVVTTTAAPAWVDPVTPAERAAWDKVNMCEEGGNWHVRGTTYSGGLGISETNWHAYGGQRDFGDEWAASPDQQIVVAMRMQTYPPDQNGCTGAW